MPELRVCEKCISRQRHEILADPNPIGIFQTYQTRINAAVKADKKIAETCK